MSESTLIPGLVYVVNVPLYKEWVEARFIGVSDDKSISGRPLRTYHFEVRKNLRPLTLTCHPGELRYFHLDNPKTNPTDPLRDILRALTGEEPPAFVKGYGYSNLDEKDYQLLVKWADKQTKPDFLPGSAILAGAIEMVFEAIRSGNIPPEPGTLDES